MGVFLIYHHINLARAGVSPLSAHIFIRAKMRPASRLDAQSAGDDDDDVRFLDDR